MALIIEFIYLAACLARQRIKNENNWYACRSKWAKRAGSFGVWLKVALYSVVYLAITDLKVKETSTMLMFSLV